MPHLTSPKVVSQTISTHWTNTIYSANRQLALEKEAARTLRNGQTLWPVRVQEDCLGVIDHWLMYADDALEEANDWPGKKVTWADVVEVHEVGRWIEDLKVELEMERYYRELEDDSDEEFYLADAHEHDATELRNLQYQLAAFPDPPLSAIRDEAADEDIPLFPSPYSTHVLSTIKEESEEGALTGRAAELQQLLDTLGAMTPHQRAIEYQAICQAGRATVEDRGSRTNRFRRTPTNERR
jgi:hypothetical protein